MRLSTRFLAPVLFASLAALAPNAQRDEVVEKVIELGRTEPQVMAHLEYLTERIGPRLTGSPNITRACQWAEAKFRSLGLDAWMEEWGTFPVGFERGPSSGGMVKPVEMEFTFGTSAWTPGTPGPVRAQAVLQPKTLEELDERRSDLRGAWIVDLPQGERPEAGDLREIRTVLEELGIAGRIRPSGAGELIITSGRWNIEWDDLPEGVTVNLIGSQHADLVERLRLGQDVELEFDIDNRFLPGPMPQYNVIADIVGSEFPDEYVVVGGHIDSWDEALGAQDNGTGCSTTIEAARLLMEAGAQPKRTIRFMLWGGEEQGLFGSRAYVQAHPEEMERISAVLVHDGGTNYLSGIAGPPAMIEQLRTALEPATTLNSAMPFTISENNGLRPSGGSDHVSFIQAGVPGFFWNQSGRSSYRYVHHTQHDTVKNVVPEYQRHSAMVVAIGAYNIANLPEMLDRTDMMAPDRGRRGGSRRRMGVMLQDTEITSVIDGGKAKAAGWEKGDVILSVDGVKVGDSSAIVEQLQRGDSKKTFRLKRGDQELESVLDYGPKGENVAARPVGAEPEEAAAKTDEEGQEGTGSE